VNRYLTSKNSKILEIGCSYGRNLVALSEVEGAHVVGCDISQVQLEKAKERLSNNGKKNVDLVWQEDGNRLPFSDSEFDFIVLWQVLEHVLSKDTKKHLLDEAVRVCKDGGFILIETPNFFFPIDYHDNAVPLAHWILPNKIRALITKTIRKVNLPPSEYTSIYQIRRFLKKSRYVSDIKQITKIYFEQKYGDIFKNIGGTRVVYKKIFFIFYYPIYLLLRLLTISGDLFTPSIRVVFQINKI